MVSGIVTLAQSAVRKNNWGVTGATTLDLSDAVTKIALHGVDNLTSIAIPISTSNAMTKSPTRMAIPLKRNELTITINGSLSDTSGGDSAVTKMKKLLGMFEGGGNTTLVWRGLTFSTTSISPVQILDVTFDDSWETILGGGAEKMDSDLPTSMFEKIPFTIKLIIARERGT